MSLPSLNPSLNLTPNTSRYLDEQLLDIRSSLNVTTGLPTSHEAHATTTMNWPTSHATNFHINQVSSAFILLEMFLMRI